jgi:hypothetical protein
MVLHGAVQLPALVAFAAGMVRQLADTPLLAMAVRLFNNVRANPYGANDQCQRRLVHELTAAQGANEMTIMTQRLASRGSSLPSRGSPQAGRPGR